MSLNESNKSDETSVAIEQENNRFQVNKVDNDKDEEDFDAEDDEQLPLATFRSFKHYTREALPHLDNYRDGNSLNARMKRPTLDELRNGDTIASRVSHQQHTGEEASKKKKQTKFGWIEGVLIRCLLNIWGVMIFLRLSWVGAQAGVVYGSLIILLATLVTVVTTVSMSAICTNGEVKTGGIYYMISRSLGPEFGGSIGVIYSCANAVALAMYAVGFAEALRDMLLEMDIVILDAGTNDLRIISLVTITVMLGIVLIGAEWESKTQMGLLVIFLSALFNFLFGVTFVPSDEQKSKGFVGWNITNFKEYLTPDYRGEDFISVFSVFFPAATGMLAGANISGDLRDPSSAIPKGSLLSIAITTFSYLLFLFIVCFTTIRDANGAVELVTSMANATDPGGYIPLIQNCSGACPYGSHNYYQTVQMMSFFGPIIYAGIFAAALSSALASLVSAPRVFQALCNDKLFPGIEYFGKGSGRNNEPRRGYFLSYALAFACCLIGEFNAIAPIISNFFLAAYVLINFSCFHASFSKSPGFRPSYRWYNPWVSLLGSVGCLVVMFIMNWSTALLTFIIEIALYLWVEHRKPDVNWGSSTQAQSFRTAVQSIYRLNFVADHVKTYRPQILLLSGHPAERSMLLELANQIVRGRGLLICGLISQDALSLKEKEKLAGKLSQYLLDRQIKAFHNIVQDTTFSVAIKSMIESLGIGKVRPNIVMLGIKHDWARCDPEEALEYYKSIHLVFDYHLSLVLFSCQDDCNQSDVENSKSEILPMPSGRDLSMKQPKGFIDVWWLFDDGGLTLLLPYLISLQQEWRNCKLRIFTLVNRKTELDQEHRNMATLLSKFRINFHDVILITDIMRPPKEKTKAEFTNLIDPFLAEEDEEEEEEKETKQGNDKQDRFNITDVDLLTFQDKIHRQLRLRESLLEHSQDSRLIVMTLPISKRAQCPGALYFAWLEMLTRGLPPTLLIRGNHSDVLTFYS